MSATTEKEKTAPMVTVAFRLPEELRDFYLSIAEKERRDLSEVLRLALDEQAGEIEARGGKLLKAA